MSILNFVRLRHASTRVTTSWVGRTLAELRTTTSQLLKHDDGQGLTEYALILALVVIVSLAASGFVGGRVTSALSTVGSSMSSSLPATTVTQPAQTTPTKPGKPKHKK